MGVNLQFPLLWFWNVGKVKRKQAFQLNLSGHDLYPFIFWLNKWIWGMAGRGRVDISLFFYKNGQVQGSLNFLGSCSYEPRSSTVDFSTKWTSSTWSSSHCTYPRPPRGATELTHNPTGDRCHGLKVQWERVKWKGTGSVIPEEGAVVPPWKTNTTRDIQNWIFSILGERGKCLLEVGLRRGIKVL